MNEYPTSTPDEIEDEEPHLTEMDRQAETREEDDGYWGDGDLW